MVTENIQMEHARLVCRNFAGARNDFNDEGNRNFGILLDDDLAEVLEKDGWNIKRFKPRPDDPSQHRQAWIKVRVKFGKIPPNIVMITSRGKSIIDENTISTLDFARIANADVIVRPYNYPAMPGRPAGVSAYLKALYVTIQEDEFASKYADIPEV